jgi:hypothetical protein
MKMRFCNDDSKEPMSCVLEVMFDFNDCVVMADTKEQAIILMKRNFQRIIDKLYNIDIQKTIGDSNNEFLDV